MNRFRQFALRRRHRRQWKRAIAAVRSIEQVSSRKLARADRAKADAYARDVLGSARYAAWLYVYTLIQGRFREGWIPDDFFGKVVVKRVNGDLRLVGDYKTLTHTILQTPALPDIGYSLDGNLFDRQREPISLPELVKIAGEHGDYAFLKADSSLQGKAVARVAVDHIDEAVLESMGNCVIQAPIRQHPSFAEFAEEAVATLRVTTVRDGEGRISVRAAYLRLGRTGEGWVQSRSSVRVAVVGPDGELDEHGYTSEWRAWLSHPDTGVTFAKRRVPRYAEALDLCCGLHRRVAQLAIVGWDVTIDLNEDVKLIEWNTNHSDIKFSEAVRGPCFSDLGWERLRL